MTADVGFAFAIALSLTSSTHHVAIDAKHRAKHLSTPRVNAAAHPYGYLKENHAWW